MGKGLPHTIFNTIHAGWVATKRQEGGRNVASKAEGGKAH